jgi:conjugal transfer pilus assembly protein TraL
VNESSGNQDERYSYRFPYRINLPLLLLFFEAKKLGITVGLLSFGNIFECFVPAACAAVVYWYAYDQAQKAGKRGLLRHRLWWWGFMPGKSVFSSRYFTDPFIRDLYS